MLLAYHSNLFYNIYQPLLSRLSRGCQQGSLPSYVVTDIVSYKETQPFGVKTIRCLALNGILAHPVN